LNYAYALEQLEAAFYATVVADAKFGVEFNANEQNVLREVADHEKAHREFFKIALGTQAIPSLALNQLNFDTFTGVNYTRNNILNTARAFEDTGVSAYNGAGAFIQNVDYLLVAGKIVSVEARHASVIRDMITPNSTSFAGDDIIDADGLEYTKTFAEVLGIVAPYLRVTLCGANLPK
jgi:hypothetical protein